MAGLLAGADRQRHRSGPPYLWIPDPVLADLSGNQPLLATPRYQAAKRLGDLRDRDW